MGLGEAGEEKHSLLCCRLFTVWELNLLAAQGCRVWWELGWVPEFGVVHDRQGVFTDDMR